MPSGILEATRSLEYRYNDDEDNLDLCYDFTESDDITRGGINSPLYKSDIKPLKDEIKSAQG